MNNAAAAASHALAPIRRLQLPMTLAATTVIAALAHAVAPR
jgi:hypothetical protein